MLPNEKLTPDTKLRMLKANELWSEERFRTHHPDYQWPGVLPADTAQSLPYLTEPSEQLAVLEPGSLFTVQSILYEAAKTYKTDRNPTGASFQCLRATASVLNSSGTPQEISGFVYTTHMGVDFAELYVEPVLPPVEPQATITVVIEAGKVTIGQAKVLGGKLREYSDRKDLLPALGGEDLRPTLGGSAGGLALEVNYGFLREVADAGDDAPLDERAPSLPRRDFRIYVGASGAIGGTLRVVATAGHYLPPDKKPDEAYDIAADGTVTGVQCAATDRLVVQAFDAQGRVASLMMAVPDADAGSDLRLPAVPNPLDAPTNRAVPIQLRAQNAAGLMDEKLVLDCLFNDKAPRYISFETLELWFSPPLIYAPGIITLQFEDVDPSENYVVYLGNADPGNTPTTLPVREPINRPQLQEIVKAPDTAVAQTYSYVRIDQIVDEKLDSKSSPGVDFSKIEAHTLAPNVVPDAVIVLLDLSGSMRRGELPAGTGRGPGGDETTKDVNFAKLLEVNLGRRLTQLAAKALRTHFLVQSNWPPLHVIGFSMLTRAEKDSKGNRLNDTDRLGWDTPYVTDDNTKQILAVYPKEGSWLRARCTALMFQCLNGEQRDWTPLKSAIKRAVQERIVNTAVPPKRPLMIVLTDGVGSKEESQPSPPEVALNETLADLRADWAKEPDDLGVGRRGFLELVGYRVPTNERHSFLGWPTGGVVNRWRVSTYDVRSEAELGNVLRGIRLKYGFVGGVPTPAPEEDYMRDSVFKKKPRSSQQAEICGAMREQWPQKYYPPPPKQ